MRLLLMAGLTLLIILPLAFAAQPTIIALQGKLTNTTTGAIIYSATLRVNISDVNGIAIWNQTYPNAVSAGFFDLLLGAAATNPLNLTYNQDYNISVYAGDSPTQIGGSFRFRSSIGQISPSNLSAGNFSSLGNFSFGSSLFVDKTNNRAGIGTTAPSSALEVIGIITATSFLGDGTTLTGVQSEAAAFKIVNATVLLDNATIIRTSNTTWWQGLYDVVATRFGNANFTTLYDARTDRFGIANYSAEYGSTGFKIANYSAEYGSTGFKVANFTSNFATQNATSGVWNTSSTALFPRDLGKNVGIGTNVPGYLLTVANTSNPVNLSGILYINGSSGNVGIGTATPGSYDSESDDLVVFRAATPGITIATSDTTSRGALRFADGTGAAAYAGAVEYDHGIGYGGAADTMYFRTAGTQKMVVTSGGNVGIGTTDPALVESGASGDKVLAINSNATTNRAGDIELEGLDNSAGVGNAFGRITFTRTGDTLARIAGYRTSAGTDAGQLGFLTQPSGGSLTERMVIDPSGNVGIGTTSPGSKLTVAGDVNLTGGSDLIISNAVAGFSSTLLYNDFGDLYINNNGWAVTLNPNAFMPTINTSSPGSGAIAKNLTIASEDGSVIVQLG